MLIKSVVTFLSFPCENRGKRFTMFNNEADSSRKKKREREKLRFKISLCPTIRGGLTFSHCAIPMHTHTIRPHYVIRAERYFDLDRSMILWRDCALFACDCINDTCKKRRRKKRKKKKKHSHPPVLVRGIPLAGRCVSNIVTTVADLHFVNIKKKKKRKLLPDSKIV